MFFFPPDISYVKADSHCQMPWRNGYQMLLLDSCQTTAFNKLPVLKGKAVIICAGVHFHRN